MVQNQLGHSSIVTTADVYISVLPDLARKAAEDTAALVLQAGRLVPGTKRVRRADRPKPAGPRRGAPRRGAPGGSTTPAGNLVRKGRAGKSRDGQK